MAQLKSTFVWHELRTFDVEAAKAFYGAAIGWETQDSSVPGMSYTLLKVGPTSVGGMIALRPETYDMGVRSCWTGYIAVDDVDAYATKVQEAGGTVHCPAADIPGTGRFAIVADPQGARFALFKALPGQVRDHLARGTPGASDWSELHATDWKPAFAFYEGLFGWQKGSAFEMGPAGTYQLFTAGAEPIGGMMSKFGAESGPLWLFYINVDDIDAAVSRVTSNGGQVINGPQQVPSGDWVAQCSDPQNAQFAMVGPRL